MRTRRQNPEAAFDAAILEMADDAFATGAMASTTYGKITERQRGKAASATHEPLSGAEIHALREEAQMTQAVFARHMNVTPSYLSQLERGLVPPTGPALVLLNVIRRHGIGVIVT